jgi:integrase
MTETKALKMISALAKDIPILRTRDERISAQIATTVINLADGTIGLLDRDSYPISVVNKYLRKMHRRGKSKKYIKNIAYNIAQWIRNAGIAGVDWLYPPEHLIEEYFQRLIARRLSIASANTEASRVHQIFRFAIEEGLREDFPYETQLVHVDHGGRQQSLIVPAFLPARGDAPTLILPSASAFRRWNEALQEDVRLAASTLQKTGVRLFELQKLARAWPSRQRVASGVAIVRIYGKGKRLRNVYVPSALADELDTYFSTHKLFMRANGKAWNDRTLSTAFCKAKKAVGFPITAHTLRHAYGSWALFRAKRLFEEKKLHATPLLVVQELLGHASYEITARTYLHIFAAGDDGDLEDIGGGPLEALIEVMEPTRLQTRRGAE